MTDAESDWVVLSRGVPQGLLLGPVFLFFNVHDLKSTLFCQIIHVWQKVGIMHLKN